MIKGQSEEATISFNNKNITGGYVIPDGVDLSLLPLKVIF
jgi:hypothetical protein